MQNHSLKFKTGEFDLKKRTYNYALAVIRLLETLPQDNASQVMTKQLLRSATSIGANIIEAQASSSKRDFANFFNYSLKSANESKFWLGLLKDSGKLKGEEISRLLDETNQIAKILAKSLITIREK